MINFHLNGDIVRCPDMRAIQKRVQEARDHNNICKYGIMEDTCDAWQQSIINWKSVIKNANCGRCMLSGSLACPGYVKRLEAGKKKKSFKIDGQVYRKISSAGHFLVKESQNKTLFITLTFPQFKRKVSDDETNSYFSKFVENLRKNYSCGGYVAVRENGKNGGRVHFHLLLSIPFVPFARLNDTWCHTIKDICHYSRNAVTSDRETLFIRNPRRALRYVCKYFSKAKNQLSDSRLVFISNNIIQQPKNLVGSIHDFLEGYKSIYIKQTSEYTTAYRITDNKEFDRFCNDFLYPLFELSVKKQEILYSYPINSS